MNCSSTTITRIEKWVHEALTSCVDALSRALFAGVLWQIWKARNLKVFQDRKPNSSTVLEEAQILTPPSGNSLKLNVDSSWLSDTLAVALAGILKNSDEIVIDGFTKPIYASSPLIAETLGV
ncbi:uncharacterized protein J3R85_015280 [Psidium guajava]|nr:uncharacterized protein J3R85_015280 [Psidium guajava]